MDVRNHGTYIAYRIKSYVGQRRILPLSCTNFTTIKFNSKTRTDRGILLDYYLKSFKQSIHRKKNTSNMSKLDEKYNAKCNLIVSMDLIG